MKPVIKILVICFFWVPAFSQGNAPAAYSRRSDYLLKSQRRQRAGIILLSSGAIVTAGGIVLVADGVHRNNRNGDYNGNGELNTGKAEIVLGALVTVLGTGSMCASVPFFVGAHRSRIKALDVSIKSENARLIAATACSRRSYPALSLRWALGK